jgi:hypothetical protein
VLYIRDLEEGGWSSAERNALARAKAVLPLIKVTNAASFSRNGPFTPYQTFVVRCKYDDAPEEQSIDRTSVGQKKWATLSITATEFTVELPGNLYFFPRSRFFRFIELWNRRN